MVAKKKTRNRPATNAGDDGNIESADELTRVRQAIQSINLEEGDTVMAAKKSAKKASGEKPARKSKKTNGNGEAADSNRVTLNALCEEFGISTAAARRKLRNAEVGREGGRWDWEEGSAALKKVRDTLQPAAE